MLISPNVNLCLLTGVVFFVLDRVQDAASLWLPFQTAAGTVTTLYKGKKIFPFCSFILEKFCFPFYFMKLDKLVWCKMFYEIIIFQGLILKNVELIKLKSRP